MRFWTSIVLTVVLSGAFALPIPTTRKVGDIVTVKPKHLTPVHPMGNQAGLNNNHPGIVLGKEADGHLRVTHVSSNPPPPNVDVHSVIHSVPDMKGKIHLGHFAIDPAHVKNSNKFPNKQLTPDEVAKIERAIKMHKVAEDAAKKGK